MIFETTPSQTVGPYFAIGLPWPEGPYAVAPGHAGRDPRSAARSTTAPARRSPTTCSRPGRPTPRAGSPTCYGYGGPSALDGLPRLRALSAHEDGDGSFEILTVKPGPVSRPSGAIAGAAHRRVGVRPRACCTACVTRIYFADEAAGQRRRSGAGARPGRAARDAARAAGRRTATASTSASRARRRRSSSPSDRALFAGVYARGEVARRPTARGHGCARCSTSRRRSRGALRTARGLIRGARERDRIAACADACARVRCSPRSAATATAMHAIAGRRAGGGAARAVGEPATPGYVHLGATSQDILDTARCWSRAARCAAARRCCAPRPRSRRRSPTRTARRRWSGARCSSRRCRRPSGCAPRAGCTDSTRLARGLPRSRDASSRCRWAARSGARSPAVAAQRRRRARARRADRCRGRRSGCAPASSRRARRAGGRAREDRPRRDAARAARGRRGSRTRDARSRRLVGDGAQAQPGRRGVRARVHDARPRARRDAARGDGAGARARGRRLAGGVGDAQRAAAPRRLGGSLVAAICSSASRSTPVRMQREPRATRNAGVAEALAPTSSRRRDELIDRALARGPAMSRSRCTTSSTARGRSRRSSSAPRSGRHWRCGSPQLSRALGGPPPVVRFDHRGHGARPRRPGIRARSRISAATCWRCSIGSGSRASVVRAVCRSAGWSACGWRSTRPSGSSSCRDLQLAHLHRRHRAGRAGRAACARPAARRSSPTPSLGRWFTRRFAAAGPAAGRARRQHAACDAGRGICGLLRG